MQVPEVLNDYGLIDIHNQQGVELFLAFEQDEDMSARTLWFEISTGFRKQQGAGYTVNQKVLAIGQGELNFLLDKVAIS